MKSHARVYNNKTSSTQEKCIKKVIKFNKSIKAEKVNTRQMKLLLILIIEDYYTDNSTDDNQNDSTILI